MLGRARILLTIATGALAMSAAAQAAAPMATFDGTYAGVSRTFEGVMTGGGGTRTCPPISQPPALTIVNGIVEWNGARGSVSPQGVLVIPAMAYGARIDAQIDNDGTVRGRLTSFCSYQMVWQKNGK